MRCSPERAVRRSGTVCRGKVFREVEGFLVSLAHLVGRSGLLQGPDSP